MADRLKGGVSSVANWMDEGTQGSSVLNAIAKGVGATANGLASIGSGAIKGVGDVATTAGNTFLHPVDSAIGMAGGMWNMWEHTPLIPSGLKGLHGAFDIASGNENGKYGNSFGELGETLAMGEQMNSDLDFWAGIGGGRDAWGKDPLEAETRTLANVAPMLLGVEEGVGGGKGARPGGAPEAPIPEGLGPRGRAAGPAAVPFDPSQPVFDEIARNNPDSVNKENSIPARQEGSVFRNEPLPQQPSPTHLDNVRVKVAEQRRGDAEFVKRNARSKK